MLLELSVLSLLSLLHSAVSSSTCRKWDISSQSKDQSLFLYFASGRFSARLSPYVIFLILRYNKVFDNPLREVVFLLIFFVKREKHGLNVMVDRKCLESVTKYFDLPPSSLLPGEPITTLHLLINDNNKFLPSSCR